MRDVLTAVRVLARALAGLVVLALLSQSAIARAQVAEERAAADAILKQAEQDDEAFAFARALSGYDEGRRRDPGSPRAPRAEARAAILRGHAEGSFGPFTELERVRRDPSRASDARVVDTLVLHAEGFPRGLVQLEVWVFAAEAYAHRFERPADAERLLERVIASPVADRVTTQKAARDLVALRVARKDLGAAEAAVELAGGRADPSLGHDVQRLKRRGYLHLAAITVLATMALLAARRALTGGRGAEARATVARSWKLVVGYAAYVAIGGALLASGYERGAATPFLWFGVVLVPVLLVARAWGATGGVGRGARTGRAGVCAAGAVAAAFLVLEGIDPGFLEGMGL